MWAVPIPYYSEYRPSARWVSAGHNVSKSPAPVVSQGESSSSQQPLANIADLLEPAIDGPPSPERIRQLSKQMKRASHLNRPQGHRNASSGSSTLLSLTGERPAWEQAMENMSLTRRSSNRSTASSVPSRERHESVQALGKNLFQRRRKSKQEGSSPGSSLHSSEMPAEASSVPLKEALIPTIFGRRRASRDDAAAAQKKVQISGPFNFQHVTHTHREQLPELQREGRMGLASDFSAMRSDSNSAPNEVDGINFQNFRFPSFSSEVINEHEEGPLSTSMARPPLIPRHTAPASGPRHMMKYARSQEQLRFSPPRPPRPPRSPVEPMYSPPRPPAPPPRVSSRSAMQYDDEVDPLQTTTLDRPPTSGGFRRPQPFSPSFNPLETLEQLPATTGHVSTPNAEDPVVNDHRLSHVLTTHEEVAWPLSNPGSVAYETVLPDVPEEEEQFTLTHRSRLSLTSNNSSLRGSFSVPALRSVAQSQRPMSGTSDTLGHFGTLGAYRARMASYYHGDDNDTCPQRESWEDDIDYCYEHEADANFDYEWERPSLDAGVRRGAAPPVQVALADDEMMEANPHSFARSSLGALFDSQSAVPALSLASQASTIVGQESAAPAAHLSVTGNFSLSRGDRPSNLKTRPDSRASSFKESHGFTLSPSLLIPGDYHQQMLLSEAERQERGMDDELPSPTSRVAAYDDFSADDHTSFLHQQRASTSTTATNLTSLTDTTGERHISTNSTWTTLTRLTSSTSLNKMTGSWSEAAEQSPTTHLADPDEEDADEVDAAPTRDTVPELTPFPTLGRKAHHKSHASESVARDEVLPVKSTEASKSRRPRARTTSLSAQTPPVGQYALFPRTYVKGKGDRI